MDHDCLDSSRDSHPTIWPVLPISETFVLQAKAKHAAISRQQQAGPMSSFSPLSAAGRLVQLVLLNNTMRGISRTVLGEAMPLIKPNPSYKAWGYLVGNELAQGVGRQMYYTDDIGMFVQSELNQQCQMSATMHMTVSKLCI